MSFLQTYPCPPNMRSSTNAHQNQICFLNAGELDGVRRGTIYGVNEDSTNPFRWSTNENQSPLKSSDAFLPPPFDNAGMTNFQILAKGEPFPTEVTASGPLPCIEGTIPIHRGDAKVNGKDVSLWQCVVPNSSFAYTRQQKLNYSV